MSEKIDFVPPEYTLARTMRKRLAQFLGGAVCVFAVLLLVVLSVRVRVVNASAEVGPLRDQLSQMTQWESQVTGLADRLDRVRQRNEVMNQLMRGAAWIDFLEDLAEATNEFVWITECRLTREKASSRDEHSEELSRLALSGIAASDIEIIDFMRELSHSPHVQALRLETSRRTATAGTQGAVEFAMTATVH